MQNNNAIEVEIHNENRLRMCQTEADKARGGIGIEHVDYKGNVYRRDLIDEGDFVMLLNYYYYIKDYDIKDDFINRDGTNDREKFSLNNDMEL